MDGSKVSSQPSWGHLKRCVRKSAWSCAKNNESEQATDSFISDCKLDAALSGQDLECLTLMAIWVALKTMQQRDLRNALDASTCHHCVRAG
jgi:hypothetical protein